jgi:hypothetical protein
VRLKFDVLLTVPRERSESGSESEKERKEPQNYYLTITTPDAMNAIPDQSTPYPLAIGSRHHPPIQLPPHLVLLEPLPC